MTEEEWEGSADPYRMLDQVRGRIRQNTRSLRLFATACCRRILHLLNEDAFSQALDAVEKYADGTASESEVREFEAAARAACGDKEDASSAESAVLYACDLGSLPFPLLKVPPIDRLSLWAIQFPEEMELSSRHRPNSCATSSG